ncbi:Protein of unknown function [Pyronema omphalodes CBS 100304]|uniref:Uncharacterized protein n=1 Tax=Pyronema omphalodes (strain CBS 100304) TaxID=1076935 RepID=U4LC71_PYROM|nr:Protein of unknown function [Pyronema omphalodes CBS 100304]
MASWVPGFGFVILECQLVMNQELGFQHKIIPITCRNFHQQLLNTS